LGVTALISGCCDTGLENRIGVGIRIGIQMDTGAFLLPGASTHTMCSLDRRTPDGETEEAFNK
jgi:hypothetical protein